MSVPHFFNAFLKPTLSRCIAGLALLIFLPPFCSAQDDQRNLASLDLEDLMKVQITSVSKHEQTLWHTAAAIFVITQEDIRNSGAANIPDLLRMVPGMNVAQLNSSNWAVTARGFNSRFANELFVMVDGRTVYIPTFGGVFWDVLDVPLENIERIEVIRGPGASVWGSNAVNGVINIITKHAKDSNRALVSATAGGVPREAGFVQVAGRFRDFADFRVFTKYSNQASLSELDGSPAADGWHMLRAGLRSDLVLTPQDSVTVTGDIYSAKEGLPTVELLSITAAGPVPVNLLSSLNGSFAQITWDHQNSSASSFQLNLVYDRFYRQDDLSEHRGTAEVDFQHNLALSERQHLTWGLQYRHSSSDTVGDLLFSLNPRNRDTNLYSGFVQDEAVLRPDKLFLTFGVRLEQPAHADFIALPTVRLAWAANPNTTLWTAFARALRTPADTDVGLRINLGALPPIAGTPAVLSVFGNPRIKSEQSLSYEFGVRRAFGKRVSADLAAFFNGYDRQQTNEPGAPFLESAPAPLHFVVPLVTSNLMHGETHGWEAFATWKVTNRWKLSPGYAFERVHMHLHGGSQDFESVREAEGSSPVNSAQLRSHLELPRNFSWDAAAYFVGRLAEPVTPSYTRVDTQLSWQWRSKLVLSAVGQNLQRDQHLELVDTENSIRSSLLPRTAYFKISWRY